MSAISDRRQKGDGMPQPVVLAITKLKFHLSFWFSDAHHNNTVIGGNHSTYLFI